MAINTIIHVLGAHHCDLFRSFVRVISVQRAQTMDSTTLLGYPLLFTGFELSLGSGHKLWMGLLQRVSRDRVILLNASLDRLGLALWDNVCKDTYQCLDSSSTLDTRVLLLLFGLLPRAERGGPAG